MEKYGFSTVDEDLELANPIAEELNTLRSTVLVNLLNAVKRNVSYSKKSIALFEIGAIFGSKREQSEVISFVISGQVEGETVVNAGKPATIDFAAFTRKVGAVIGAFELVPCTAKNGLNHPYQSADIVHRWKSMWFPFESYIRQWLKILVSRILLSQNWILMHCCQNTLMLSLFLNFRVFIKTSLLS